MIWLGNEQRSFCHFWDCIQVLHFTVLVVYEGYSIFLKRLPKIVDMMVIWVKFTRSVHFSLLIPKMLTFTLAISCLTTSNLPWFMDLTFQVHMQYCSSQYQTLLLSPVTSTTVCCFCFGSIFSFFLELYLYWSPVAYWVPTDLGEFIFQCHIFLPFHTVHGSLKARILKWFTILISIGPHFVRTLHHDPSILGGPTWYGS